MNMQMRRVLMGSVTLLVVVGLVGCGSTKRLTLKQYKAKANAICADAQTKSDKLKTPSSVAAFQSYSKDYNGIQEDALKQLKKIHPPTSEEKKFNAYTSAQGDFLQKEVQRVVTSKDFATQVFNGKATLSNAQKADSTAKAADLTKCESGG